MDTIVPPIITGFLTSHEVRQAASLGAVCLSTERCWFWLYSILFIHEYRYYMYHLQLCYMFILKSLSTSCNDIRCAGMDIQFLWRTVFL